MRIIPAIDLIDGKCVRLHQGKYERQTTYEGSPLDVARRFEDAGIHYLHLVDLEGAKAGKVVQWRHLEEITQGTDLQVDFGGGVHTDDDIRIVFESGASQVTGGTIAVRNPELFATWLRTYGPEKIILGADANRGKIAVSGWQDSTELDVIDFIEQHINRGVQYVVCTDIAVDGTLAGPATNLYRRIINRLPNMKLVASGGVATISHLLDLRDIGVDGTILGKSLFEGTITLKALAELC